VIFKRLFKVKSKIPIYASFKIKQLLYEILSYKMLCFWDIRLSHFDWLILYTSYRIYFFLIKILIKKFYTLCHKKVWILELSRKDDVFKKIFYTKVVEYQVIHHRMTLVWLKQSYNLEIATSLPWIFLIRIPIFYCIFL